MRIYLYLVAEILNFTIPKDIAGSFSFDENPEEDSKLINIEARNGNWVIYSTDEVSVIYDNNLVSEALLVAGTFYVVRRNEINYLIYVSELFEKNLLTYTYDQGLDLIIGNDSNCNIQYSCEFIKGVLLRIHCVNNQVLLEKNESSKIYINNKSLTINKYYLKIGDLIDVYGLRIMFLNGLLLINNPGGRARIFASQAKIGVYYLSSLEPPQDIEVKDVELYGKNDYFSKSPRLRRVMEKKEIDLSPPPRQEGEKEMPLILTIGPMLTMGVMSVVTLINTINKVYLGETTFAKSWTSLFSAGAMLISMLVWPLLTKRYNKKLKIRKNKELVEKYGKYLEEKKKELASEAKLQKEILIENLITVEECLNIIKNGNRNFWDKRTDQSDFLVVRIGKGNELLNVKVNYPEEGFTIEEDELRKQADKMVEEFKYIENVPIGYSLYENRITAIMGNESKGFSFVNNMILQLITFYSYEDLKLVVFTNDNNEEQWNYIKYLNHNFTNDRRHRFFASSVESNKNLADFFNNEVNNRIQFISENKNVSFKPYYLIIIDGYDNVRRFNFIKTLTELDINIGFSILILEKRLNKLPSKCSNFISLGDKTSGILKNSYEKQEQLIFYDEINYAINMMSVVKKLSNVPIEFEGGNRQLPDSLTFLEMEKVGKVEQLNILNRWNTNDSTASLRAEVGVDEDGDLLYLDLHEKFHGPHGLIAGMTGSGKSEFIITYILSMAMNYSPDDVSFILIDYKGGGLAFAFENKATGVALPHLAGTITNLDKAEMDRTLVSIDSEIKRRQKIFNGARDTLGESTIDIYKYQRFYKEGRLQEAVPHLFIICDEFAELKSQQPEFMDNLISVARIGRSLGIHLILATQKPSGVVNDQIWSNSKFRVCLKVQDASDSNEMLKRPDAAGLKQTGRFYLQVGYNEYFALGQSGWCGAKYYPSEKILKQVDKSINFIDDTGNFIKSIQAGNNIKIEAQGEQISAIMQSIIAIAKQTNKKAKRLWLDNIAPIILVDNLLVKYQIQSVPYRVDAIIGEYDAPEKQEQGILKLSFMEQGNTIIYGNDAAEREKLLSTIFYSTFIKHSAGEVNLYMVDYGSESLRTFANFPQVGGMVFMGDDEEFKNLFKLIIEEIKTRKKKFIPYGGSFESYNNANEEKLPLILFVLNNYEGILESYQTIFDDISSISRDCQRYGIIFMITCNTPSAVGRRVSQNFENKYALHFTDSSDYFSAFNLKCKVKPRDIFGRGLAYNDGIHEFQTASIVDLEHSEIEYLQQIANKLNEGNSVKAKPIPSLPEKVTFDIIKNSISTLSKVPIGMGKDSLKIIKHDFTSIPAITIASNKLVNINSFMDSLLDILVRIPNLTVIFLDLLQLMPDANNKGINYFDNNFNDVFDRLLDVEKKVMESDNSRIVYIFYGLEKLKSKIDPISKIDNLFKDVKKSENTYIIFCDDGKKIKSLDFESWFSPIRNNTDGIWIGNGFTDQSVFRINKLTKEMSKSIRNNYGYYLSEGSAELIKFIEFNDLLDEEDNDE